MTEVLEKTPLEVINDEIALVKQSPLALVEGEFLRIKTKSGGIINLQLNSVQKIILAIIQKQINENKPIRLLILKARQMGVTTLIQGIMYAYTSVFEGVNSIVIADALEGSNYIFEMQKMFHEYMLSENSHLTPPKRHSNEKKLEFEGLHSQVLIDTAENKDAGRKLTIRYCHISEAAFFVDLDGIMVGLNQSVPNNPNTFVIIESTANGVGNAFYNRWEEAKKHKSDWLPIFIPWFVLPEYSRPLDSGELYPIDNLKGDIGKFVKEESLLKTKHELTYEQLNWRRWCIINNCNGELDKFRQEYPSTDLEAFIMSGNLYFNREQLLRQEEKSLLIKAKGFPKIGDIVKLDNKYQFRECEEGRFRVFEYPDRDSTYCIGADAAEGLPHGDDSAMIVLNKKTNKVALAYNCTCDGDEFAEDLIKAARFYNSCMIAPESKGYGSAVCRKIYNHYGNIYKKIRDNTGHIDVSDELGWNTNSSTRPAMLAQLKNEIAENSTDLLDEELLGECRTFINHPKKKRPEAENGKKDDLVFARAIAGMVRSYYPHLSRIANSEASAYLNRREIKPNQGLGFRTEN